MNSTQCMVCRDKDHFRTKVNDVKNINVHLEQVLLKYGQIHKMEESDDLRLFISDCMHQHFMCGTCVRVNEGDLRREENKLNKNLLKLCYLIKEDKVNVADYNIVLRLLAGYYHGKYKALESVWRKEKM